jgi:hypothetical protein
MTKSELTAGSTKTVVVAALSLVGSKEVFACGPCRGSTCDGTQLTVLDFPPRSRVSGVSIR